jgi:hypothetical protein
VIATGLGGARRPRSLVAAASGGGRSDPFEAPSFLTD